MRKIENFNNDWIFIDQPVSLQQAEKMQGNRVNLPHTWNGLDGQDGGANYRRELSWYVKKFKRPEGQRIYIQFNAVNSSAVVYINGHKVVSHDGGYSMFRAEITEYLKDENIITVSADNGVNDYVYPQFADFTFYGGIYRDVSIISVTDVHFDLNDYASAGMYITPVLKDKDAHVNIRTCVEKSAKGHEITVRILDHDDNIVAQTTQRYDKPEFDFVIENAHLWDGIHDPYLYKAQAVLTKDNTTVDTIESTFGVRTFHVDPEKGFFLNGKSYPLRGVSRHQDRLDVGNALSKQDHEQDMRLIAEMGTNYIRLAHYQHDQYFYDLCDKYGMVVWAEIPFISRYLEKGDENAMSQMQELVKQNYNHASIMFWGLSNEITIGGEVGDGLLAIHKKLNDFCHDFDPIRMTVMAHVSMLETDSPLTNATDIFAYNHYYGWYGGDVHDNGPWLDDFHKKYPDKPIGLSEYGCEAVLSWHTSNPVQGDYSEEYQAFYHEVLLETFSTRPFIWSTAVWNMFDFGSDMRNEGGVMGRNNKGLVTLDRKIKKDSYYIYKAWWSKDPFVHITGRRYIDRAEKTTQVKVYSNQSSVELFVNGKSAGVQTGSRIFTFDVPLKNGKNTLVAKSGNLVDEIELNRVKKPNPDYQLPFGDSDIANWFDGKGKKVKFEFPDGYFSVKDRIDKIMANPEGAALLKSVLDTMGKQLSDTGMEMPANFMSMLGAFSIERLFSIAGMTGKKLPKELLLQLNQALNKIKK